MKSYQFLVTITARSREVAREELAGALEDARDSQIIKDFDVDDNDAISDEPTTCVDCGGQFLVTHETMMRNKGLVHLDESICKSVLSQTPESIADAVKRADSHIKQHGHIVEIDTNPR